MSNTTSDDLRVDHIAVAVPDLETALQFYRDTLGMRVIAVEIVESEGVKVAKLDAGNTHIELLEPLSGDTAVGKFLTKRGSGLHHVCFGVPDIEKRMDCLNSDGVRMINQEPKKGAGGARIAFVHPASTGGVLLEISQPPPDGSEK